jgi:hypothetical protein
MLRWRLPFEAFWLIMILEPEMSSDSIDLGRWLIAAGLVSNTVAVFDIDQKTGGMVFHNVLVNSPTPMCVELQAVP